jgi:hypothetical protein
MMPPPTHLLDRRAYGSENSCSAFDSIRQARKSGCASAKSALHPRSGGLPPFRAPTRLVRRATMDAGQQHPRNRQSLDRWTLCWAERRSRLYPDCVKTCASRECAELFCPLRPFDRRQCYSFPIQPNRDEISALNKRQWSQSWQNATQRRSLCLPPSLEC